MPRGSYISRIAVCLAGAAILVLLVAMPAASTPRSSNGCHRTTGHRRACPIKRTAFPEPLGTNLDFFAQSSIWNSRVPANAAIDPNSSNVVGSLLAQIRPTFVDLDDSGNLYVAGRHTPRQRVTLDEDGGPAMQAALSAVPIPSDAQPTVGSDARMAIYQPSTDTMWEFWRMSKEADGWHAAWGGRMFDVSTDPGYYRNVVSPAGHILEQDDWGAPATSFPLIAGVIMISELERGVIPHAIAFAIGHTCAHEFAAPAQRTDGDVNPAVDPNCVPEGAHFRLDPNLNIAALNLPPLIRIMAVAAQKYGMIIDNRTSGVSVYDQSPTAYIADWGYNPYFGPENQPGTPGALYDAWPTSEILKFPWSHLELLKMDLRTKPDTTVYTERHTRSNRR
jgi:hypothetical protein